MIGVRQEENITEFEREAGFAANMIVRILIGAAVLPIVSLIIVLAYYIRPTENLIILHYNVYFGVDVLGMWWQAYFSSVLAIAFFIGHVVLAKYFYERSERIAAYLLLLSSGWLALGALIAGGSVAFINY